MSPASQHKTISPTPFIDRPSDSSRLPSDQRQRFRHLFTAQAVRSHVHLSLGMGIVALLMPILLMLSGQYDQHMSISHYYYATGDNGYNRSVFVGSLWATGTFLLLFEGLSRIENWFLNAAGLAAIGVSMFPMGDDQASCGGSLTLHATFAMFFFLCIAVVAILFSKDRIRYIISPVVKRTFRTTYNLAAAAMIGLPGSVVVGHFLSLYERGGHSCVHSSHWIFWAECFGIWAFSLYWFAKTMEYRLLLGIR